MTSRAQTTFDFAIGMSVFLLTVVLVFALLPTAFAPFTADTDASVVVADRSASRLVGVLLSENSQPAVLNETCTEAFFDGSTPAGCQFDTTDLSEALGLGPGTNANVTIERLNGTVYRDFSKGPEPPSFSDLTLSVRIVMFDGVRLMVHVRVW